MPFFIISISFTVIFAKKGYTVQSMPEYGVPLTHNFPYKEEKNISCSYKGKQRPEKTVRWHTFLSV